MVPLVWNNSSRGRAEILVTLWSLDPLLNDVEYRSVLALTSTVKKQNFEVLTLLKGHSQGGG